MVELRLLGSLRLAASDGRDLEPLVRQAKRTALLAYLAAAVPHGYQRRDTLLALFWPELDDGHARAALNQALYVLRNALGEQAILTRGDGEVGLSSDVVWCDVTAFEAALDGGRPAEGLGLYGGDLLEGFFVPGADAFERWLETERGRLRHRASEGAWAAAEAKAAEGDAVEATRWARRAADLLPDDEAVVRRLMTFLHRLGDRAAAIRAYEAFAWRLNKEYEVEPSAETQALALALREEGRHPAAVRMVKLAGPAPAILVAIQRRVPLPWAVATLLAISGLGAGAWARLRPEPAPRSVVRFTLPLAAGGLIKRGVPGSTIALSPDGARFAFLAQDERGSRLFLRMMDRIEAAPIPHTREAYLPFFSPDGEWLGFVAEGRIWKVPLAGGPAITVCTVGSTVMGASWGSNDVIVFATETAMWQVPGGGGAARVVAASDTARGLRYRWPHVLPRGRAAVVTRVDSSGFGLVAVSLADGSVRPLGLEGTSPQYVEPGYLVFARQDGALLATRFDANALRITGPPFPVADGIIVGTHGAARVGISRAGALAYIPEQLTDRALVLVDRAGKGDTVPLAQQAYQAARFSPDGRRIATAVASPGGSQHDIWILDVGRRSFSRLTFDSGSLDPHWTPDGQRVVFATSSGGVGPGFAVEWMAADGTDSAQVLLASEQGQVPLGVTPDAQALVIQRGDPETRGDIWVLPLAGERRPRPYLTTAYNERAGTVSPDGRWLAYTSDDSDRDEIYVRAFPTAGPAVRVSEGGGREPRWAPSGRELFYRSEGGVVAAALGASSAFTVGRREVLFDDRRYVAIPNGAGYDVHPDGSRFLMVRRGSESHDVVVVLNWFDQPRLGRR